MPQKVAVIGVGSMGRNHARIFSDLPNIELVGVSDVSEANARNVAHQFGGQAYTDYRKMLEETRPEAVTIAVPTSDHYQIAVDVIQRGIHLLVEKPITLEIAEAKEIIAAAEARRVKLMVGHIERFNPAVQALKTRIDAGDMGRVFQIDARRQGPFPARIRDVGVVIDLAVHDVDIIRFLCSADVTRVYAETETRIHSTNEDLLCGLMRMSNGAVGTLTINWLTPTKIRELYVTGEAGMYRVDYLTQDLFFYENASAHGLEWETLRVLRGVNEGRMIRFVVPKKEPLRSELEAFLAAVRGEAEIGVTGADGLEALKVAKAIVTSGSESHVVTLGQ